MKRTIRSDLEKVIKQKRNYRKIIMDWMTIIQSIVIASSIVIAGLWFLLRGEAEPKAIISHEISHVKLDNNYKWISFWVTLENKGSSSVIVNNGSIRVRQILPIEFIDINNQVIDINKMKNIEINCEEDNKKERVTYKVDWPVIKSYKLSNVRWTLRPGEKERLRYEFVISSKVDTLKIYTHFYGDDRNKGWREATLYKIKD